MTTLFEDVLASTWNALQRKPVQRTPRGLRLGRIVVDGRVGNDWLIVPETLAESHIFILGATGVGKTRLIDSIILQAIGLRLGVISIIQHPDLLPFMVSAMAEAEKRSGKDLSGRCVIVNFADRIWATGLNLLESAGDHELFILAAELSEMIRVRFDLDAVGVRVLELLRMSVFVLASTGCTLVEFRVFLKNPAFRSSLLRRISNEEVKAYFTDHYDRLSSAERDMYSAALLNKLSELTADPTIADLVGQQQSAVSIAEALDDQLVMPFNADKSALRELGATLAALFFVRLKNAIFARKRAGLSLVVCDEVQNLVVHDAGLDLALSESRKMHTGFVTANQSLEQLSPQTRAALLGCGTQCFFRLSAPDADKVASYLGGGKRLAERLKALPQRHMMVKIGAQRLQEVEVPPVADPKIDPTDFYQRSMRRWARRRADVQQEIKERHAQFTTGKKDLADWE